MAPHLNSFEGSPTFTPFECSICMEMCTQLADSFVTSCGHQFHAVCMDTWEKSSVTCPLCRSNVAKQDVAETNDAGGENVFIDMMEEMYPDLPEELDEDLLDMVNVLSMGKNAEEMEDIYMLARLVQME